jgi:hypothetical protein
MRLTEFADPRAYTLPADDTADSAGSRRQIGTDRSANDPASSARSSRGQPPIKPRKLIDAL